MTGKSTGHYNSLVVSIMCSSFFPGALSYSCFLVFNGTVMVGITFHLTVVKAMPISNTDTDTEQLFRTLNKHRYRYRKWQCITQLIYMINETFMTSVQCHGAGKNTNVPCTGLCPV